MAWFLVLVWVLGKARGARQGVEVLPAIGWLWRDGGGARRVSRRWEGFAVLRVTVTLVAWGGLEVGVLDLSGGGKRAWPGVVVGGDGRSYWRPVSDLSLKRYCVEIYARSGLRILPSSAALDHGYRDLMLI